MGNVLSETDGLGNVTTYAYNDLEQRTSTAQGQVANVASGQAEFANLPQVPGQARTYTIYLQSLASPGRCTVTDNRNGSPTWAEYAGNDPTITPLGAGWYQAGTLTLAAGDLGSAVNFNDLGSATRICLVEQVSGTTYTPTGLVATETDADDNTTTYGYDAVGIKRRRPARPCRPARRSRPTPTTPWALTAETDPMGHTTAYNYAEGSGTDTVSTWQGQTLAPDAGSGSTSQTWTFSNLPLGNDVAGGSSVPRVYNVYAQAASGSGFSASDGSLATSPAPGLNASALGSGWTWVGTVTLGGSDATTTLVVTHSGAATATNVLPLAVDYHRHLQRRRQPDKGGRRGWAIRRPTPTITWVSRAAAGDNRPSQLGAIYDKAGNVISNTDLLGQHDRATSTTTSVNSS